jgi:hypothetical protein
MENSMNEPTSQCEVDCFNHVDSFDATPNSLSSKTSAQNEMDLIVEKLRTGFTRLPNSLLMEMIYGDLSKADIKILLLIARLTISYKDPETGKERKFAPLSKNTITLYTGIQGKNVLNSLKHLEKKGWIRKIQGNHLDQNQFGLVYSDGLFDRPQPPTSPDLNPPEQLPQQPKKVIHTDSPSTPNQTLQNESQEQKIPMGEDQESNHPKGLESTAPQEQKETPPEDQKSNHYKQYKLNNELNYEFINYNQTTNDESNAFIQGYLNTVSPGRRENEEQKYQELKKTLRSQQIATGLSYLLKCGIPKTGQSCHSPMAFLFVGFRDVLKSVGQLSSSSEKHVHRPESPIPKDQPVDTTSWPKDSFEEKRAAFQKAFPTEESRKKYFSKLTERNAFIRLCKEPERMTVYCWAEETGLSASA